MDAFETTIDVRPADLGRNGHVNNSRFVDFLDLARDRYFESVHGYGADDLGLVTVHLEIDFEREVRSFEPVTVGVDPDAIGRTSVSLGYEVRSEGHLAATGTTVTVAVESAGTPRPLPGDLREGLRGALSSGTDGA